MTRIVLDSDGDIFINHSSATAQDIDNLPDRVKDCMLLLDLAMPVGQVQGIAQINGVGALHCIDRKLSHGYTRRVYELEDHD